MPRKNNIHRPSNGRRDPGPAASEKIARELKALMAERREASEKEAK